jgi:hypothetical protein
MFFLPAFDRKVPTNYRIKTKPGAAAIVIRDDEDKNLGRWVNRQRSLYQAGKLRKDRQLVRCCGKYGYIIFVLCVGFLTRSFCSSLWRRLV